MLHVFSLYCIILNMYLIIISFKKLNINLCFYGFILQILYTSFIGVSA